MNWFTASKSSDSITSKFHDMKKKAILILSFAFSLLISSQSHAQSVVSSQGESFTNTEGSIDYTLGEVIIFTGEGGSNDLTQGFHQSSISTNSIIDHPEIELEIYPNPSSDFLSIRTDDWENVECAIYDVLGKEVQSFSLSNITTSIDVQEWANGSYTLLINKGNKQESFKIIVSR